jgi:hypothetical protein
MASVKTIWAAILSLFGFGCGYADTFDEGIPNLHRFAGQTGMWRTGHPPDVLAWEALRQIVTAYPMSDRKVTFVQLHDDAEGDTSHVLAMGWTLVKAPLPPEDDKPWSVLEIPSKTSVNSAVDVILAARAAGDIVIWGCKHGRDRTSLVSAVIGQRLFGWTKKDAWDDMVQHGFRWELPDLDAYFLLNSKR